MSECLDIDGSIILKLNLGEIVDEDVNWFRI
jgi:hypothetical protein